MKYIANDGKIFSTEQECLKYEQELESKAQRIEESRNAVKKARIEYEEACKVYRELTNTERTKECYTTCTNAAEAFGIVLDRLFGGDNGNN